MRHLKLVDAAFISELQGRLDAQLKVNGGVATSELLKRAPVRRKLKTYDDCAWCSESLEPGDTVWTDADRENNYCTKACCENAD